MSTCLDRSNVVIRDGAAVDAPSVFGLLQEAFREYIPYTIYRSPKSINYLSSLMQEAERDTAQFVKVLDFDGHTVGFYIARNAQDCSFLSYVCVHQNEANKGLGKQLLRNFEANARGLGMKFCELDVFESNSIATRWYLRRGYEEVSRSFICELTLRSSRAASANTVCTTLRIDPESFHHAMLEEEDRGFSSVECEMNGQALTLGFLDKTCCKLLNYSPQLKLQDLLDATEACFPTRTSIVAGNLTAVPVNRKLIRSHQCLRLRKSLDS